jgi:hypothetical protein
LLLTTIQIWYCRGMKFTPGQAQEILQLSPATFRHWKSALPPLSGRNGYSPCFTPGDLLAMAVVKTLTEGIGIRVGNLQGLAIPLFGHCSQSWAGLERSLLIINPLHESLDAAPEAQPVALGGLVIAMPLRPIIASLRERLLLEQTDDQQEPLRFPPTPLGVDTRRSGSS